jgi:tetratricopeptide (TPR) repeat protein
LLRFIGGDIPAAEDDLANAREIFRRDGDVAGLSFALSLYAETARLAGRVDEARTRRLETLDLYLGEADDPFVLGSRAYSRAILSMLDGDLAAAEGHYRTAAAGFGQSDRPVMKAMTLGVLSDIDERSGKYCDAVEELEEAVELAETVGMRGFVGSLYARLAWSLLEAGDADRAELMIKRSFDAGRRLRSAHILFLAHAAAAALHRLRGRNDEAASNAAEALRIHEIEGPSRFRNRIDPDFEIAAVLAVCCTVLGVIATESGDVDRGADLLQEADRLRAGVGADVPKFQVSDVELVRSALTTA